MVVPQRVAGQDVPTEALADADVPPALGGGRERRVSARAYNYWVSLLAGRDFPSVADLNANDIGAFRDHSILLDFTADPEQPVLRYIGKGLREESGLSTNELRPQDVPGKSLLSRLTAHYLEIIANRAPIGFEAEFHNVHGRLTFYRGILLPLSDDDVSINFIYGVISWKEEAPPEQTADALAALAGVAGAAPLAPLAPVKSRTIASVDDIFELSRRDAAPVAQPVALAPKPLAPKPAATDAWHPSDSADYDDSDDARPADDILDLVPADAPPLDLVSPEPLDLIEPEPLDLAVRDEAGDPPLELADPAGPADDVLDLAAPAIVPAADDDAIARLADRLAAARDAADNIKSADSRSRAALYAALAEALAFHSEASADPAAFAVLLDDAGLTMQDRAPFTPTVKMIFGVDHDKTRLTEYAAALSHAHREAVAPAEFSAYLEGFPGGLKGIVQAERSQRAAAQGNRRVDRAGDARVALKLAPVQGTVLGTGVSVDSDGLVLLVGRANAAGGIDIVAAAPPHAGTMDSVLRQLKRKR